MVQIVAYSSLATCNIFSDSYPNLCCLQNTVQEASPPTKTFSTQCPVCPLSLLPSSLSWVFSYSVWWRVLVSCRFQSSCVCPVSPRCILSPGGTTSESVLRDEAWLHLLVHKLTKFWLQNWELFSCKSTGKSFCIWSCQSLDKWASVTSFEMKCFWASLFDLEFFLSIQDQASIC